ncbi:MAG TPA: DUF1841 family protein [Burkholderiales bacterium]|nr:DUF1841 family protein [Burkholderiales bacterium]
MFSPSREQVRALFFETWRRYLAGEALSPLETMALDAILLHPEYHAMLENPQRFLERDFTPEDGSLNPFLHLSLHLAVAEQLSIDQPPGICAEYERIARKRSDAHEAAHVVLECLGETLWEAQRLGRPPDSEGYLECLRQRG